MFTFFTYHDYNLEAFQNTNPPYNYLIILKLQYGVFCFINNNIYCKQRIILF